MPTMQTQAESLVKRARLGDQNAMGMIQSISVAASKGGERAQLAAGLIKEYIDKHPVTVRKRARFGADYGAIKVAEPLKRAVHQDDEATIIALVPMAGSSSDCMVACSILLANGQALNNSKIKSIASLFGDHYKIFLYGVLNANRMRTISEFASESPPEERRVLHSGCCFGMARSLQKVRLPHTPITPFSAMAGWELGE